MKPLINYEHHVESVLKFNEISGNNNVDKEQLLVLYRNLCKEEFSGKNEFKESLFKNDLVGQVDGLADMFYVGTYWYHLQHGKTYLDQSPYIKLTNINGLRTSCKNIEDSLELEDSEKYMNNLMSLYLSYSDMVCLGRALDAVHESNLSKFVDMTGLPLECVMERGEIEVGYLSSKYNIPTSDIDWKLVKYEDQQYLVFRNSDGKIIKPSTFEDVDLTWVKQ